MRLSFLAAVLLAGIPLHALGSGGQWLSSHMARTIGFSAASAAMVFGLVQLSYSMAYKDPLTGLPGRRALEEMLDRLSGRYSIAMLDVDHFKKFNDRYGHEVGDQVLKMVASKLKRTAKGKAYRYGGEEFTVVVPGLDASRAVVYLEDLRVAIEESKLTLRSRKRPRNKPKGRVKPRVKGKQKKVSVTVSIGVADAGAGRRGPRDVLKEADKLLYKAKKAGRNRVVAQAGRR